MNKAIENKVMPDVGIIFFSEGASGDTAAEAYNVLFDVAELADKGGFSSLWTPERHFQKIGGPYPNPSILAAALAKTTSNIGIRAGSVNLSLHDPIRVAEEWSVVDNLSGGRVGMAFAAGWHPGDFILNPDVYEDRRNLFNEKLEQVKKLWSGQTIERRGVNGTNEDVSTYPRPVQSDINIWLTVTQNIEAWEYAAKNGYNILTALISQDRATLTKNIAHYQRLRSEHGHAKGVVTLMLHTYVSDCDESEILNTVKSPLKSYLSSFLKQQQKHTSGTKTAERQETEELVKRNFDALLELSFNRYRNNSSLIGNIEDCGEILTSLKSEGVDEVACLLDYGLSSEKIIESVKNVTTIINRDHVVNNKEIDPVKLVLDDSIRGMLDIDSIDHDVGIMELGLSSIELAEVALVVQKKFGLEFDFETLYENPSITSLADKIRSQVAA
jgi:natural product biosynthesis luciferase-like monooxygenase protein